MQSQPANHRLRTVILRIQRACCYLALIAFALHGCERSPDNARDALENQLGIMRTAEEGPVSVLLTVSPRAPDLSQSVRVHLEITADATVTMIDPDYGDVLSTGDRVFEYRAREVSREKAKPIGDGRLRWAYDYDLDFVLAGEYELPGADVSFTMVGPDDEALEFSVSTEPILLGVAAATEIALSNEDLRTLTRLDPVELPWSWPSAKWLVAIGVVVVAAVAALVLWRRRRRVEKIEIPIAADIWARRELAALLADQLLEKELIQEFFYRISAIVRGYIERRFQVSAPEMTTEEFLAETASDRRFGDGNSAELDKFLCACDMVKYAKHLPVSSECQAVLTAAGDFIERTRRRVAPGGATEDRQSGSPAEERAA